MNVSIEEAKTRWCPLVTQEYNLRRQWLKEGDLVYGCIANNCMAWEEDETGLKGYCGAVKKNN